MQPNDLNALEQQIKRLIVDELQLEDLEPDDIGPDMPLFAGGLGLSSVNAMQLDAALGRHFAVLLVGDDVGRRGGGIDLFRYSTVRLLAEHLGGAGSTADGLPVALDVGARRRAALLEKTGGRKV